MRGRRRRRRCLDAGCGGPPETGRPAARCRAWTLAILFRAGPADVTAHSGRVLAGHPGALPGTSLRGEAAGNDAALAAAPGPSRLADSARSPLVHAELGAWAELGQVAEVGGAGGPAFQDRGADAVGLGIADWDGAAARVPPIAVALAADVVAALALGIARLTGVAGLAGGAASIRAASLAVAIRHADALSFGSASKEWRAPIAGAAASVRKAPSPLAIRDAGACPVRACLVARLVALGVGAAVALGDRKSVV